MADPYWRYPSVDGRDANGAYPSHFPPDASSFPSHHLLGSNNPAATPSEFSHSNVLPLRAGGYTVNDLAGISTPVAPGTSGLASGANMRGFSPLEGQTLVRRDVSLGREPDITEIERSNPPRIPDGLSDNESNVLYVDCLPTDCTRREVSHLFRPFIGFKEIRVVHKEPRRAGEKAQVLCFVEFKDTRCALTAMEALQGYKFDDKKPDSPTLKIQFAKFPFHPPGHDDRRRGSVH
ncbi:U1 small nuclear ribonucleoprotein A/U2 small nuclear ribonucleoprotein B'' protein [Dioscorea alata]|uniref:U1 small nuclear ribonucleoprotein A/U2 small nuclear ribonucleoprotein B'' protein n=2 Tax=Dioscorea alata TaxID=55571 RepID=A0ACB7WFF0_DIOAL|nr:U1 small nuclear ribonucleoprotein A/U2 small nuclear ribonucleoprotein B'' protein [Dioscorea alata]KAH7686517.1 U1 small nuclear ribonucleoprotein A/U2 small nuclear ribonucleoprotein B'' protein [Dioscorea alata]